LFRTAGHIVLTQHGVTASAGQRHGDVEIRSFLQDGVGRRSLVFDQSMTHDSTSTRMHGEFLRLLFLQAHLETEAHFIAAGISSQQNQSDSFRFKRAAFYQNLKSKLDSRQPKQRR
jgi:hypothetical protein